MGKEIRLLVPITIKGLRKWFPPILIPGQKQQTTYYLRHY